MMVEALIAMKPTLMGKIDPPADEEDLRRSEWQPNYSLSPKRGPRIIFR